MGFVAHSAPNYAAAKAAGIDYSGPPQVTALVPLPIFAQVNGVFNVSRRTFLDNPGSSLIRHSLYRR